MLILREFKRSDRDEIVSILNCSEVTEFLSSRIPSPYTVNDAEWWLETGCKQGLIRAIEINGKFAVASVLSPDSMNTFLRVKSATGLQKSSGIRAMRLRR